MRSSESVFSTSSVTKSQCIFTPGFVTFLFFLLFAFLLLFPWSLVNVLPPLSCVTCTWRIVIMDAQGAMTTG